MCRVATRYVVNTIIHNLISCKFDRTRLSTLHVFSALKILLIHLSHFLGDFTKDKKKRYRHYLLTLIFSVKIRSLYYVKNHSHFIDLFNLFSTSLLFLYSPNSSNINIEYFDQNFSFFSHFILL